MLEVVAEQTGYPTELLDMDLDLEADLGIDTVKQAEVFATIRETYGIERDDALKLRDYPTLNHVVAFVNERSGAAPSQRPKPRPSLPPSPRPSAPTASRGAFPCPSSGLRSTAACRRGSSWPTVPASSS